ncbi:hypothetical protein COP1_022920 [Malus domestica]
MASSSSPSNPIAIPSLPNTSNFLTIKLDRTNYPLWHAQMLPLLRSRNLVSFVDGTNSCPPAFLKDDAGQLTDKVNPDFDAWIQQDAMVLSWINSSVHPTVLASLISKTSSLSAWTCLRDKYASQSTGRLLQLRSELMNTHRGDSSIAEFLDRINCLADTISLSGSPVTDSDLVAIILNNVRPAYESTVASAQARDEAITYSALEALLLGAERRQKLHTVFENGPTALAAGRGRSGPSRGRDAPRGGCGHFNGGRGQFLPRPQGYEHHAPPLRHPHNGVLGALPSPTQSGGRIQCQICRRHGHSAIDCFNRLNMAYEGRVPAPRLQAYAAAAPSPASVSPSGIQNWLFDSGANAHITYDLNQVSNPRPYNGTDNVNGVVDGSGLHISHVGTSFIHTPYHSFTLPNTLHCPNASTNDLQTGKTLLQGRSKNGFDPFSSSSVVNHGVSAFVGVRVSDAIWHSRLGNNNAYLSQFIMQLRTHFAMKDLGPLHYFLGMEVSRMPSAFYLTQSKYILELLQKTNMVDAKPISTPVPSGKRLSLYDGEPLSDGSSFRSVVGALQYLLFTRPDIAYAVNQVCQFMHSPTTAHWAAVKRILRYLKGTHDHGLLYKPSPLTLTAFADADYAGDPDNRRSTGGHCIFLGDNLISWSSKKQRGVSRSSTEAEYRQLAYTSAHLSWFHNLFRDLYLPLQPHRLWCDNISAIAVASNPVYQARMRHVEVDYHYIRDKVIRKEIEVGYVATTDQIANFLTKGLSSVRFHYLISKLPVRQRPVSLRGRDKPNSDKSPNPNNQSMSAPPIPRCNLQPTSCTTWTKEMLHMDTTFLDS